MSSRSGQRGGAYGGRRGAPNLPFDIDPELAEAVDRAEEEGGSDDDDFQKDLFPDLGEYIMAARITDEERKGVRIQRDIQAKRRAGPFWTGTREQLTELDSRSAGNINPFEAVPTYSKKRKQKSFELPDFKRVKCIYPELFPKELQDIVTNNSKGAISGAQRMNIELAKKSAAAKLINLDNEEADGNTDDAASDVESDKDSNGSDRLEDDDFEEDENGEDDDYNAEKYFNDDEGDLDDFGGDEHGNE